MWQHDQMTITDGELLQILKERPAGSITVLDGPTACGKTRLLKQLEASGVRSVKTHSVEAIKELIIERAYTSPNIQRILGDSDIIAIDDIDFLKTAETFQTAAAILIEKASSEHAVIIAGIKIGERIPVMMEILERRRDDLLVWKYKS